MHAPTAFVDDARVVALLAMLVAVLAAAVGTVDWAARISALPLGLVCPACAWLLVALFLDVAARPWFVALRDLPRVLYASALSVAAGMACVALIARLFTVVAADTREQTAHLLQAVFTFALALVAATVAAVLVRRWRRYIHANAAGGGAAELTINR